MELEYDSRSRISNQKIVFGRSTSSDRIAYSADGHLVEVVGKSNWKYLYDENGNAVGIVDQGQKLSLGYDSGDRIVQVHSNFFSAFLSHCISSTYEISVNRMTGW